MAKLVWDSSREQVPFEVVPKGDYNFKIIDAEEGIMNSKGVTNGCDFLKITIGIGGADGSLRTAFKEQLIFHENTYWKVQDMLKSVNFNGGNLDDGNEIELCAANIVGYRGRARVGIREYKDKADELKQVNEVVKFLDEKKLPRDIELAKKKFPDFFGPAEDEKKIPF